MFPGLSSRKTCCKEGGGTTQRRPRILVDRVWKVPLHIEQSVHSRPAQCLFLSPLLSSTSYRRHRHVRIHELDEQALYSSESSVRLEGIGAHRPSLASAEETTGREFLVESFHPDLRAICWVDESCEVLAFAVELPGASSASLSCDRC